MVLCARTPERNLVSNISQGHLDSPDCPESEACPDQRDHEATRDPLDRGDSPVVPGRGALLGLLASPVSVSDCQFTFTATS